MAHNIRYDDNHQEYYGKVVQKKVGEEMEKVEENYLLEAYFFISVVT